jgi:hypothetical protein
MIIATSQDRDAVDCCGCAYPSCAEPRKECESISVDACGFTLPEHTDVPPEDACQIYRKRTDSFTFASTDVDTSTPPFTSTRTQSGTSTNVRQSYYNSETSECAERFFSGSYDFTEHLVVNDDGDPVSDQTAVFSTSAGIDEVWTGTFTYTDGLDSGNNDSYAISDEAEVLLTVTEDWTYSSPGIFSISNPTGDETSRTETVTFSEPLTVDHLNEDLDAAIDSLEPETSWPESECESTVSKIEVYDEEEPPALICEKLTGATRARYRYGIPSGYMGSVWVMQWDEVFLPDGYDATINDPEIEPPDPLPEEWTHPQIPDPEAPPIELIASRSWTYGGSEEWSEWFTLAIPEEPGTTVTGNVLVKCYASTRLGVVPTASGETYIIPEP